jgi:hypothetical protein
VTEEVTRDYLLYVVLPLWLAAGFADWLCHRRARIEATSGAVESAIHLLMLAEAGGAVLLGLFFEINALILLLMTIAFAAHEVTAHWDLRYAFAHRRVTPTEQHVHDYLGAIPFMALSFVAVLHWEQAAALLGLGPDPADFSLSWKRVPLPLSYIATLLGVIALIEVIPYLEELGRGLRFRSRRGTAPTHRS